MKLKIAYNSALLEQYNNNADMDSLHCVHGNPLPTVTGYNIELYTPPSTRSKIAGENRGFSHWSKSKDAIKLAVEYFTKIQLATSTNSNRKHGFAILDDQYCVSVSTEDVIEMIPYLNNDGVYHGRIYVSTRKGLVIEPSYVIEPLPVVIPREEGMNKLYRAKDCPVFFIPLCKRQLKYEYKSTYGQHVVKKLDTIMFMSNAEPKALNAKLVKDTTLDSTDVFGAFGITTDVCAVDTMSTYVAHESLFDTEWGLVSEQNVFSTELMTHCKRILSEITDKRMDKPLSTYGDEQFVFN